MSEIPAAAPAAPAAPAATPAASAVPSLIDGASPATTPAASAAPVTPVVPAKWFYDENVPGTGDVPEWLKTAKYKSAIEQAKAYPELEKKFGSFTGAPKDGFKFNVPEGFELAEGYKLEEDPMFAGFADWAKESNLSQEGFDKIVGLWAQHNSLPDPAAQIAEAKKALGEKADSRIAAVVTWGNANLDAAEFAKLRSATTGENAAAVVEVVEAIIAKTRQPAMPKPGDDVPLGGANAEAAIKAEMAKRGPDGKLLYFTYNAEGQTHREKVEKLQRDLYNAKQGQAA